MRPSRISVVVICKIDDECLPSFDFRISLTDLIGTILSF